MARTGRINRRSFLAQVIGTGLGAGALAAVGAARAQEPGRRMVIDADPNDPAREPPSSPSGTGPSRDPGGADPPASPYDTDSGATADSAQSGPSPPTGVTDTDTGPRADPVGRGRHGGTSSGSGGSGRRYSVVTDNDSGPNSDSAGHGRGSGPAAANQGPAPPSAASPEPGGPRESFIICPGHPRCPQ